ncbi:hypothetical protein [Frateuria soli]|uniref:hypothetical protein n=1 Tax=Frateuria soli TaxID=1542730 RepID=UPI001E35E9B6|nr:hypothetical protein [Frateuria soli]UGB37172.1 hypothetical protein LQ771_10025 [Frateuria soli]
MTDTIDLLETIGCDSSLRHASAEELARVLEQAKAPEALKAAVAAGDSSMLSAALGQPQPFQAPQITQMPAHEEEPLEEEPLDIPAPDSK